MQSTYDPVFHYDQISPQDQDRFLCCEALEIRTLFRLPGIPHKFLEVTTGAVINVLAN